ncbi:MAG: FAD-dependent oxidoreductase [Burkholderiaceae bacterium]
MGTRFDAIIVGAGPAGATAAALLARAGWSVALVEKQSFPRRKVCGECIAASNLALLDAIGIGTRFAELAGPELRRVVLMHGADAVAAALPAGQHPGHRHGRALGREALDTLLLNQARSSGAQVFQPASVQAIEGDPGAWRCTLRGPPGADAVVLESRCVIAANGSWEALPSERLPRRERRAASDLFAFKANFNSAAIAPGDLAVLGFAGGYGGMVQADAGITTVACCIRRDRLDAMRRSTPDVAAGAAVQALLEREVAGVKATLAPAQRDGPWLAAGPLAPGIRLRSDDRILRIGNAAGEAHPIIGEGMSMALQSAWLLAGLLIASTLPGSTPPPDLAAVYARRWRREFAPRLALAAGFAHLAMRPAGAGALIALARRWPGLLTQGARWGGKVRCAVDRATIQAHDTRSDRSCGPAAADRVKATP